ncbi:sortase [Microlunatus sp. Y2014]|uniref:sortase n=1 Tax=Microlunatus sp. Y2014 TaxID=3418488 RepID=UPI003DA76571
MAKPGRRADRVAGAGTESPLGRWWVALPLLIVIAVVPWLVLWQQVEQAVTAGPAAGSSSGAPAPATSPPGPTRPDDGSVRSLASEVARAKGYDVPVSPEEVAAVTTRPGPYVSLGSLQIPSVGVDVTYGEGVHAEALTRGPGHWPGTPLPGRAGNSVISGHRNTHTQPFKRLDEVRRGDEIVVTGATGEAVTFVVQETAIVPEATYKEFVLQQPTDPQARQVTLFACHPEGAGPVARAGELPAVGTVGEVDQVAQQAVGPACRIGVVGAPRVGATGLDDLDRPQARQ